MQGKHTAPDTFDMRVESVTDDGTVVLRFPGGNRMTFRVSTELVPSYRRLIPHDAVN